MGDVGDEAVDRDDMGPPGDLEVGGDGRGAHARTADESGQPRTEERPAGRPGIMGDGESLEIEIGHRGQRDQEVDHRRIRACRGVGLGPDDEAAEGEEEDAGHDRERGDVDDEGEDEPEPRPAEEIEAVEEALEGVGDGHRVEGQGAVEDADVHEAGEQALAPQRAALEEDLGHGVDEPRPEVPEPVLGRAGPDDPDPADDRDEERRRRRQDQQGEYEFFRGRQHAGTP